MLQKPFLIATFTQKLMILLELYIIVQLDNAQEELFKFHKWGLLVQMELDVLNCKLFHMGHSELALFMTE